MTRGGLYYPMAEVDKYYVGMARSWFRARDKSGVFVVARVGRAHRVKWLADIMQQARRG